MVAVSLCRLFNLRLLDIRQLSQLRNRGAALMDLLKLIDLLIDLAQGTALVQRQTYDTALLCNSLKDTLANPPYGIGDELKAARFIEFLCSLNQSDISLIDQVGQRQSLMLVLLGYGNDKAEVGCYQTLLSSFAFRASLTDGLSQFNLLINGY